MQQLYKNARTALKAGLTIIKNRLETANEDLGKFKDPALSVHDKDGLLVALSTHDSILTKKVTMCNDKIKKINMFMDKVTKKEAEQ